VLSICRNRCLWRWQHSGRGARLLADKLPPGKVHWVGAGANGWESLAVVGQLQSSRLWLLRVDLAAGTCRSIPLELGGHSPRGVCGHGGMLFVVYDDCADVFGPLDGHRQELLKLPRGARWRHGRFLRRQDSWYAISHDGLAAHAEPLGVPRRWQAPPRFLALVDRAGCDGPIALTTDGHLYDLAHNRVIRVSHGLSGILLVEAIARDGSCIVISQGDDQAKMAVIEVPSGVSYRVSGNPATIAEASVFGATVRTRNLSHHFRAVCVQSDHLVLVRPKDTCARIEPDQHQHDVVLRSEAVAADQRRLAVEFRQIDSPTDAGYTLRLAAWDDGSRAVLDSRGLLHLKSSDPAIPEVTLVLCEGALAGWCADGRWFGPAYFIAEHAPTRGAAIYKQVLKPFVARLR